MNKVCVIGIGYSPLSERAHNIINDAHLILASSRLEEVFRMYDVWKSSGEKIVVIDNIDETLATLKSAWKEEKRVVLLSSGDPLFYGIGRRVCEEMGKEHVEIIPDLSCLQVAFSRIAESWDDALLISVHGGPGGKRKRRLPYTIQDIPRLILSGKGKIGVLTDSTRSPSAIANEIARSALAPSSLTMVVCERLGYEDEHIVTGTPDEITKMEFVSPNVVLILSDQENVAVNTEREGSEKNSVRFGFGEDELLHSRGLITKSEVRAVTVHKLRLPREGVFWDIGAGSGSVSIEVARLFPGIRVFAVERNEEEVKTIRENKKHFETTNVQVLKGEAPHVLASLPSPDRVFIGGSGGRLDEIIDYISERKADIVVINAATLETLNRATEKLESSVFTVDVTQIGVSRMKSLGKGSSFAPLNPVFIIRGVRN